MSSCEQRIKQWYNNHTRGETSGSGERRRILDLNIKPKKQLPDWQTYSTLYYKDQLKDRIRDEWDAKYLAENPDRDPETAIPPPMMAYRNQKTREYFEAETDEVKNKVNEARTKDKPAENETEEGLDGDEGKRLQRLAMYDQ